MVRAFKRMTLVAVLVLSTTAPVLVQERPSIFVGPQIRDGFIDIDAGIRDSIRDIRQQIPRGFSVADDRDNATLVLIVLGRGIVTNGSIGSGVVVNGIGSSVVAPNATPTLTTILRVGAYERRMQSEGGTWTKAAEAAVSDVVAWWEANSATVAALRRGK